LWGYDDDYGSLKVTISALAGFQLKNSKLKIGPKMAMLGGNGVKILNFGFVALKAYPASFDVCCVKIGEGVLAVGERKYPKR